MNIRKIASAEPDKPWFDPLSFHTAEDGPGGVPVSTMDACRIAYAADRWLKLTVAIYRARNRRTA